LRAIRRQKRKCWQCSQRPLKGAVARHIDRFAFREAPLPFDWQDTLKN
jgi:hypothetical protein